MMIKIYRKWIISSSWFPNVKNIRQKKNETTTFAQVYDFILQLYLFVFKSHSFNCFLHQDNRPTNTNANTLATRQFHKSILIYYLWTKYWIHIWKCMRNTHIFCLQFIFAFSRLSLHSPIYIHYLYIKHWASPWESKYYDGFGDDKTPTH